MWFYSACRSDEKESKVGSYGSLVQHGGEYESKGVPAMLDKLYELPEGKKILGPLQMEIYVRFIFTYFITGQNYEFLGFAAIAEVSILLI